MSNTSTSDSLLNELMDIITNPLLSRDDRQTRSHTLLQQDDIPVNSIRNGRTPLTNAILFFQQNVVTQLLNREEIDVNLPDNFGSTPLTVAVKLTVTVAE